MKNGYNPKIVTAFFASEGVPEPDFEYRFCKDRKWAFDVAWPVGWYHFKNQHGGDSDLRIARPLAVEVQGGIFSQGRHNRGAAMLKEWEKLNTAARIGWRILYCQPSELCMVDFANIIKLALNL